MCQNTLIDSLLNFHHLYNFYNKDELCKEKKCREKMEKEERVMGFGFSITFILVSSIPHMIWRLYEQARFWIEFLLFFFHIFFFNKYHFLISFLIFDFYVFNCENREVGYNICSRLSKAFFGEQTHQKHPLTASLTQFFILFFYYSCYSSFLEEESTVANTVATPNIFFPHSLSLLIRKQSQMNANSLPGCVCVYMK